MVTSNYNVYEFTTDGNEEGSESFPSVNLTGVRDLRIALKSSSPDNKTRRYAATINMSGTPVADQNARVLHFPVTTDGTPQIIRTFDTIYQFSRKLDPILISNNGKDFTYEYFYYEYGNAVANTYTLHVQTVQEPFLFNIPLPNVAVGGLRTVNVVKREDLLGNNVYDVFSAYIPE